MADRDVTVRLRADISAYSRDLKIAAAETQAFGRAADRVGGSGGPLARTESQAKSTGSEIDKLSGRLRVLTDVVTLGAPTITAFGAAGAGAMVSLAAEAGAAAGALGVTVLALSGVGKGLKALDTYQAAPTTENLAKLNIELKKLGPSGAEFVRYLDSIEPKLKDLQMTARDGLLPGAQEGIDELLTRLPQVRMLIRRTATEVGNLMVEGGDAIASDKLDAFLKYLHKDGVPILDDTARTVGNLALAGLNLMAAFAPLQTDFSGGLLDWSRNLEKASEGLDKNAGLHEFISYIDDVGPKAADTLGSVANAALQIVEATAPLGGPALVILGKVADVIAAIADSDLGTPIFGGLAALALYNRALALSVAMSEKVAAGGISVTSSLSRNATAQYQGLRALPGMYREVAAAELEVAAAEKAADAARQSYIGRLRLYNQQVAAGSFAGAPAVQAGSQGRVLDSLGQLELANRRVSNATEAAAAAESQRRASLRQSAGELGKTAGLIGGLTLATSGLADSTEHANAMNLALMGSFAGPEGAAFGFAVGSVLDLKGAYDALNQSVSDLNTAASGTDTAVLEQQIAAKKKELADLQAGPSTGRRITEGALTAFNLSGPMISKDQLGTSKIDDLQKALAAAEAQLAGLKDGSIQTFNPVHALAEAIGNAADMSEKQAQSLSDAIDRMQKMREEALRAVNAQLNYQAAIDDATKAIKDNGRNFDITTEKGRANRQALYALADGWNQQSDAAKNAKGSLQDARANFIKTAEQMGATADQARNLAKRLFEIPTKRVTTVTANTSQADAALRALKARMDLIRDKHVSVTVNTVRPQGGQVQTEEQVGGGKHSALGGTVPKTGLGYVDRHPYLLADGEEVISNRFGQADRHRALLKKINAGMAGGGTAGGGRSRPYQMFTSEYGADIIDSAHGIAQALKMLQAALAKSEKSLTKERQSRDDLQSQFDSIKSTVGSAYSSKDPFAQSSSSWGASNPLASFDSAVASNTANTTAAQTALAFAASHGLDGPLYAALAASGNLPLLQQFAQLSNAQIDQREQAFAAQSNAQSSLGGMAAQAEVGLQLAAANTRLDKVVSEVKGLRHDVKQADMNNQQSHKKSAKDIKDGVNGAATNGHRRGR